MKTIKEIQEENRKLIILANNPEAKSYDEARKTIIEKKGWNYEDECKYNAIDNVIRLYYDLTLDRVLMAIKQVCRKKKYHTGFALLLRYSEIFYIEHELDDSMTSFGKWDLTKPTLEEQTQQTQIEINKLLTE